MGFNMCLYRFKQPTEKDIAYLVKHGTGANKGRHSNLQIFEKKFIEDNEGLFREIKPFLVECVIPDIDMFKTIDGKAICRDYCEENDEYQLCSIFSPQTPDGVWQLGFRGKKHNQRITLTQEEMKKYRIKSMYEAYAICATEVCIWHKGWDVLDALEREVGELNQYEFIHCNYRQLAILSRFKKEGYNKQSWSEYDDDLYFVLE